MTKTLTKKTGLLYGLAIAVLSIVLQIPFFSRLLGRLFGLKGGPDRQKMMIDND